MASSSDANNATTPYLLPVGIDLGSLNSRIAIIREDSAEAQIIPNTQGQHFTHAISTPESEPENGKKTEFIYGDAAQRHLIRSGSQERPEEYLVRKMCRQAASDDDDDNGGSNGDDDGARTVKESSAGAFLGHLTELACDASAVKPSTLRVVVSVPNGGSRDVIKGVLKCCDAGVKGLIASKEGKRKKKEMAKEDLVLGVISDAAAVCVAHGLTKLTKTEETTTNGSANGNHATLPNRKRCLVIDWGNSGLNLTWLSILNADDTAPLLHTVETTHHANCSGEKILSTLVQHLVTAFKTKHRAYRNENILASKKTAFKLHNAAKDAVKTLSQTNTTAVFIDGVFDGLDLNASLTRARWEMLCGPVLRLAEAALRGVYKRCCREGDEVVVLTAGSVCQMPCVVAMVKRLFPNAWRGEGIAPEECVAIGCALQAKACLEGCAMLKERGVGAEEGKGQEKLQIVDTLGEVEVPVSPIAIGIILLATDEIYNTDSDNLLLSSSEQNGTEHKLLSTFIHFGMPLPANVSKVITCPKLDTNQESPSWSRVAIAQLFQNNDKRVIGTIDGLTDSEQIEVTVELAVDGKLTMAVNGDECLTM